MLDPEPRPSQGLVAHNRILAFCQEEGGGKGESTCKMLKAGVGSFGQLYPSAEVDNKRWPFQ